MEWMRDSSWQFYGVIVAVITAIAAIILPKLQQGKRDLRYDVLYNGPLFIIADSVAGKVKVVFNDKSLSNAQLMLLSISNSGDVPIHTDDYLQSMIVFFPNYVQILHAELAESKPKNIKTSVSLQENSVEIAPTLLNKGESITLKVITNSPTKDVYIDSRIVGISEPRAYGNAIIKFFSANASKVAIGLLIGMMIFSGFSLFVTLQQAVIPDFETAKLIINNLRNIGFVLMVNGIVLSLLIPLTYGGYTRVKQPAKVTAKSTNRKEKTTTTVTQKTRNSKTSRVKHR